MDSWDEGSDNDFDKEEPTTKKPSLLAAMKKSTGKGIFDDDENPPSPVSINKGVLAPKHTPKAVKEDYDILGDLLDDIDFDKPKSTPAPASTKPQENNQKETFQSKATPKTPSRSALNFDGDDIMGILDKPTTPNRRAPNTAPNQAITQKPKDSGLFSDSDDILAMFNKPSTAPQARNEAPKASNKFDSLFDDDDDDGPPSRTVNTPITRGPQNDTSGFVPSGSGGGRSRRGLNSGIPSSTPIKSAIDELFADDDPAPPKRDIFRVDDRPQLKSASAAMDRRNMLDVGPTNLMSQSMAPATAPHLQTEDRPMTPLRHGQSRRPQQQNGDDLFSANRPPSHGRRGNTAQSSAFNNSQVGDEIFSDMPPGTPQRRPQPQNGDDLFSVNRPPSHGRRGNTAQNNMQNPPHHDDTLFSDVEPSRPGQALSGTATPARRGALPWEQQSQVESEPVSITHQVAGIANLLNKPGEGADIKGPVELRQAKLALEKELEKKEKEIQELKKNHRAEIEKLEATLVERDDAITEFEYQLRKKNEELKELENSSTTKSSELQKAMDAMSEEHKKEIADIQRDLNDRIQILELTIRDKDSTLETEMSRATVLLQEREMELQREFEVTRKKLEQDMKELDIAHKAEREELERNAEEELREVKEEHDVAMEKQKNQHKHEVSHILMYRKLPDSSKIRRKRVDSDIIEDNQAIPDADVADAKGMLENNDLLTFDEKEFIVETICLYLRDLTEDVEKQKTELATERERLKDVVYAMEMHFRQISRASVVSQNKLFKDEAKFKEEKEKFYKEVLEKERAISLDRELLDNFRKNLTEKKEQVEQDLATEMMEVRREKSRLENISELVKSQRTPSKQEDILLEKMEKFKVQKELWEKTVLQKKRIFKDLEQRESNLTAEKLRVEGLRERLLEKTRQNSEYAEALRTARDECMSVQKQLAKLEAELRMKEQEVDLRQAAFHENEVALKKERERLYSGRTHGMKPNTTCPTCTSRHSPGATPLMNTWMTPIIDKQRRSYKTYTDLENGHQSSKYPSQAVIDLTEALQHTTTGGSSPVLTPPDSRWSGLRNAHSPGYR